MPAPSPPLSPRWLPAVACVRLLLPAPSPVAAQAGRVLALDGEWIRIDSSNDPNDNMRRVALAFLRTCAPR